MVGRSGRARRCALEMSPAARAWERARIRELGLEDVVWDHAAWCPRCRAAARKAASEAWTPPERMPGDKRQEEHSVAAPESERAPAREEPSPLPGRRSARRGKRRRQGKPQGSG